MSSCASSLTSFNDNGFGKDPVQFKSSRSSILESPWFSVTTVFLLGVLGTHRSTLAAVYPSITRESKSRNLIGVPSTSAIATFSGTNCTDLTPTSVPYDEGASSAIKTGMHCYELEPSQLQRWSTHLQDSMPRMLVQFRASHPVWIICDATSVVD